ncbi:uncharacterized protein PAC_08505 [Phialocephala subalpina]|uniref:Uncharacterized protein n=1 Tax=Phialocephala subalpina TaxID=576137 RepID=A0A1L7X0R1_9HELO|nr:uncharacterized protein PAC_08505 [Phialocephala subalpina]
MTKQAETKCSTVNQNVSMCCRSSKVGGSSSDACLANGPCVNTAGSAPTYWCASCTHPTWTSLGDATKYCFRNINTAYCGTSSEITIPPLYQPSSTIGITSTATVTYTPSSTPSTQGLSAGAKAGIRVLAAVAAVMAAVGVVLFMMLRRMQRKVRIEASGVTSTILGGEEVRGNEVAKVEPELHSSSVPWELPGGNVGYFDEPHGSIEKTR